MKAINPALVLSICIASGACFKEAPLATLPPAPATRIVAQLTDAGTVEMGNALGAGATEVEGVVARADQNEWTLQMMRVEHRDGRSILWSRESVSFPTASLINPSVIVLDKRRSVFAAIGITVGAFMIARAFGVVGGQEEEDIEPIPQQSVIGVRRR